MTPSGLPPHSGRLLSAIVALALLASLSAHPSGADGAEIPKTAAGESQAYASGGDAWQETGPLPMKVAGLILVPLSDGRVLAFAGASQPGLPPATMPPQVFDPVTGSWSAIAEPPWWPNSKTGPIAVALADGRVLVAGGSDNPVASYLFDPTAGELGAWSSTQPMTSGTRGGAGALLDDGRVLAVDHAWWYYRSAEIFDPQSETWTPIAPASAGGIGGHLLPLRDGRALLVGGFDGEGPWDLNCVGGNGTIYDPAADTWTSIGSGAFLGVGSESVLLKDGRVLAVGGWCARRENGGRVYSYSRRAYIFDPATGEWSEGASMRDQRAFFTLATLHDGRVLAAGGIADGGGMVYEPSAAEIYEPGLDRWIPAPDLLEGTSRQGSVVLQDGRVLVAGGWVLTDVPTDRSEIYTPNRVTRYAGPSRFHTAAQISLHTFEPGVEVAYIANAYNFPDALAGAAAAGTKRGPVLLAAATGPLHPATVAELTRLKPQRIVVLGGPGMISDAVANALKAYAGG